MNDIQNQSVRAQTASSVAPQVQSPKQAAEQHSKVTAETAKAVQESGNVLPQEQMSDDAKSVEVKEAVSKLNEYVQKTQRDLDFQLDEDSGKTIIRVYDRQSETLVRQIPDEVALELAKKLNTEEPSLLFSAQV